MTRNAFYTDATFKTYFDMRKFENSIYNKEILRERRINVRKKQKVLDTILSVFVIVFSVAFLAISGMIAYNYVRIARLDSQIKKLETLIESTKRKNETENESLDKIIKYDDLKMKAYLELNMILPTDKNIIYFDKSDQGFVRQYENIR